MDKKATLEIFRKKAEEGEKQSLRFNEGKPQFSLIDFESIEPLARVLMYGLEKYGHDNWKNSPKEGPIQYIDSAMRHLTALSDGELCDEESGLRHVGHIMANMMMFQYHTKDVDKDV